MRPRTLASRMKDLDASAFARVYRGISRFAQACGNTRFCIALAAALLAIVLLTLLVVGRAAVS